jgi:hypothetical protein
MLSSSTSNKRIALFLIPSRGSARRRCRQTTPHNTLRRQSAAAAGVSGVIQAVRRRPVTGAIARAEMRSCVRITLPGARAYIH